jgi:signal transduction histidine kinase
MLPAINFFALAGILIAATSLFMAVLMFFLGDKMLNRIWGIFCLSVFIWGLSFYFIASSTTPDVALFWWKISHIGVILIPVLFITFVYIFLEEINRPTLIALYCISAIFLFADLQTNFFIVHARLAFNQFYYDSAGILYLPFVVFFHGLIVYGHYLLLRAYLSSKNPQLKEQIRYFFMATIVGFLGGGVSFLPVFGIDIYPYTIITVSLYPIIMGYAILKYRLFDIRVVAAQIMALLIFIFTFIRVFTSQTIFEYIFNGGLLIISLGLGAYLIRSVTKEIEAREIIQKQEEELQTINKQQENILHFISHEIKGYLTKSEAGFSAIVEGDFGKTTPELHDMANMALNEVRKGVRTVMDILDASNLKRGTVQFKMAVFDLKDVVTRVADHLKPAADEKHLTIDMRLAWELPCKVNGDEEKIREHVVRNLIDNAIKYTPRGTIKIEVTPKDSVIRLVIEDSGVGITPEDMLRLFTEGGHGKDSVKINVHSTGYGLYIAKQVVDAHGGKIWAESGGEGKGSRFVVEFPAA